MRQNTKRFVAKLVTSSAVEMMIKAITYERLVKRSLKFRLCTILN